MKVPERKGREGRCKDRKRDRKEEKNVREEKESKKY